MDSLPSPRSTRATESERSFWKGWPLVLTVLAVTLAVVVPLTAWIKHRPATTGGQGAGPSEARPRPRSAAAPLAPLDPGWSETPAESPELGENEREQPPAEYSPPPGPAPTRAVDTSLVFTPPVAAAAAAEPAKSDTPAAAVRAAAPEAAPPSDAEVRRAPPVQPEPGEVRPVARDTGLVFTPPQAIDK